MLRKDFTIDEVQVYESRAIGADAILLIAPRSPTTRCSPICTRSRSRSAWRVLVEAHDAREIERAVRAGAHDRRRQQPRPRDVQGGPRRRRRALPRCIPPAVIAVAESAVRSPADAARLGAVGFDAVLVGEALVRADDPAALVRDLGAAPVNRRS